MGDSGLLTKLLEDLKLPVKGIIDVAVLEIVGVDLSELCNSGDC